MDTATASGPGAISCITAAERQLRSDSPMLVDGNRATGGRFVALTKAALALDVGDSSYPWPRRYAITFSPCLRKFSWDPYSPVYKSSDVERTRNSYLRTTIPFASLTREKQLQRMEMWEENLRRHVHDGLNPLEEAPVPQTPKKRSKQNKKRQLKKQREIRLKAEREQLYQPLQQPPPQYLQQTPMPGVRPCWRDKHASKFQRSHPPPAYQHGGHNFLPAFGAAGGFHPAV
ncbi:hypothetical protein TraAM80_09566 [Trypanosoma rangeli]|uniref:Uncharacterized protein n=1 Tax=Trypanosoma rangeli TaxID=5698 RepID=A0A3R7M055_TRYRA|nr:uncharacterized protein TraAM80_09566 [Trypanosoma rangeli]RNE96935.1 hypothetical protein TraAM80_09566 [Trypanosoma rangeli]|eukprot:RNE96935.1 hypothetical protein TraAM80_09566 [Trypanosoma rangeli]